MPFPDVCNALEKFQEKEIAWSIGALGLNCRENDICANKNIVLNFLISRVLALSTNHSMPYAPCSMPKNRKLNWHLNNYSLITNTTA